MTRMLWLGLLMLAGLLLSMSAFAQQEIEEADEAEQLPGADNLPYEDEDVPGINVEDPLGEEESIPSINVDDAIAEEEDVPDINDEDPLGEEESIPSINVDDAIAEEEDVRTADEETGTREVRKKIHNIIPVKHHIPDVLKIETLEKNNVPLKISAQKLNFDIHHERVKAEVVEHMNQVAEESNPNAQEEVTVSEEHEPLEHIKPVKDEVVQGEYISRHEKMKEAAKLYEERKRKEAMERIGKLRRSDRKMDEGGNITKKLVYIKPMAPDQEFQILPQDEIKDDIVEPQQVVFIDAQSHAHIVHKHQHYAKSFKHDEM